MMARDRRASAALGQPSVGPAHEAPNQVQPVQPKPPRAAWAGPLAGYVPGTSVFHRLPVGVKFAGLFLLTGAIALIPSWRLGVGALLIACASVLVADLGPVRLARTLRRLVLWTVPLAALVAWQRGWLAGVEVAADLAACVIFAVVFTATTRADHLIDVLVRASRPLDRLPVALTLGFSSQRFALAVALMLRTIPELLTTAGQVRDAARARGLERNPRAYLTPLAIASVARANAVGDALTARGIADADPGHPTSSAAQTALQ